MIQLALCRKGLMIQYLQTHSYYGDLAPALILERPMKFFRIVIHASTRAILQEKSHVCGAHS